MPDNQTVYHSRSIFDQKNHINFLSLVQSKFEEISLKTYKISEQQINPKVIRYPHCKFLYWYQEFLCPAEPLYFSDEKSIIVEK